jgi:acylglycerol lipase
MADIVCKSWDFGTDLAGYAWKVSNPRAVLLLQHGYGEYAQRYVEHHSQLIPHLLDAGISVYAFDMRGQGRSPGTRAVTNVAEAVQDHLRARAALQAECLPLYLYGHSLGGFVTASSAAADQTLISGVILSSTAFPDAYPFWVRFAADMLARLFPAYDAPIRNAKVFARIPAEVEAAKHDRLLVRRKVTNIVAATVLDQAHQNEKRYAGWQVPVLVLHGSADTSTNPENSKKFFKKIPAADKTLHIVPGGYHELLNDNDREETLRAILDWLEERLHAK